MHSFKNDHGRFVGAGIGGDLGAYTDVGNGYLLVHGGGDFIMAADDKKTLVGAEARVGGTYMFDMGYSLGGVGLETGVRHVGATQMFVRPKVTFSPDSDAFFAHAGLDITGAGLGVTIGLKVDLFDNY